MAEAIGLAASIASILQIAGQITQLSYSYVNDIKNAPKMQKKYLQEISAFTDVLFRAEQAIQEAEATGLLPDRPTSLNDNVLKECRRTLSTLHLDLEKRSRRLLWPFQEKELKKHIDTLHKFRAIFADFLSASILATTNTIYKKVEVINQEQIRCQLLARFPQSDLFLRSRPTACPGTGRWFLDGEVYDNWRCGPPSLLWCYGSPGVGKSFLAAIVIDHLWESRADTGIVVYCFCDFSAQDQQRPLDILQCLLKQLIDQGDCEVIAALNGLCKDPSKLRNQKDLAQILTKAYALKNTYLILDAPDELKEPDSLLCYLPLFVQAGCRVLVTSRDLPNIRNQLRTADKIELRSNFGDLKIYIESRFLESDFANEVDQSSGILNEIALKSSDIFLLAKLILDEVLNLTTVRQIRKALEKQPTGLHQAFGCSLERINSQSDARRSLAHRLLGWVAYTKRRLKMEEILYAFAVEEDSDNVEKENLPSPDLLLRLCVGLVVLDAKDGTLGMVHTSAYEFFRQGFQPSEEIQMDIARTCLRYLAIGPLREGPCRNSAEASNRFQNAPFLNYSARYWGKHIGGEDMEKELESEILKILGDEKLSASAFQALQYRDDFNTELSESFFESLPTGQDELHTAAYWNLSYTTKMYLRKGANSSTLDSQGWTPLHWACSNSHFAVAEVLVKNGAEINEQDSQGWTPLFWAAFVGSLDIVRLLLASHANHLARSTLGWTALHWAISRGQLEIVKELLDHHSRTQGLTAAVSNLSLDRVNFYAKGGIPPVQAAAEAGDQEIFDLLVRHLQTTGAEVGDPTFNKIWTREAFDIPVSSNPWRTLTKGEMCNGPEYFIPDLSSSYGRGTTESWSLNSIEWKSKLLFSAIRDSQFSAVQLLIKSGADVNYESELSTPLHAAAQRSDPCYARILLQNGANPGEINGKGETALHQAVMNGYMETIETMVEGGADVNKPVAAKHYMESTSGTFLCFGRRFYEFRSEYSTTLIQACGFILEGVSNSTIAMDITELLLSKGANPSMQDMAGMTALHYAMLQPHLPYIKLLVDAGANPELMDYGGRTPLHFLAMYSGKDCSAADLKAITLLLLHDSQNRLRVSMLNQPIQKRIPETSPDVDIGPKAIRRSASGPLLSMDSQEMGTSVAVALKNNSWEMFRILRELGGVIPEDLPLNPILAEAVKDMNHHMVNILIDHGIRLDESIIITLVESPSLPVGTGGQPICGDGLDGFRHVLAKLVAAGANVNFVDPGSKQTPLSIVAGRIQSDAILLELLNQGADLYHSCHRYFDPILTAAVHMNTGLHCLLKHALSHPKANHWSEYLNSMQVGDADNIELICSCLEMGRLLDMANDQGQTLLHLAAESGNSHLITSLLSHNANDKVLDHNGWLPAHWAGFSKHLDALQCFYPINPDAQRYSPSTDASITTKSLNREILEKKDESGRTMLQVAINDNATQMVTYLMKLGADLGFGQIRGWVDKSPAFCYAAEHGYSEVVSSLISYGASLEATDDYGWQPLHFACFEGHTDVVKTLLDTGADVSATTEKWNNSYKKPTGLYHGSKWAGQPLHLAAMGGYVEIVDMLLERGADIHANTGSSGLFPGHGPTALHILLDTDTFYGRAGQALDEHRLKIAQMLVNRGARVDNIDQIAARFSLNDILKFKNFGGLWDTLRAGQPDEGE